MLSLLGLGKKAVVAVDVGNHTIKLAQFLFNKNIPVLDRFSYFPVPENCVRENHLFNIELLSNPLSDFINKNNELKVRSLRVCISGKFVFIKKIEIPREEKKLLEELIHIEAKETLPFNLNEINYDYKIMENIQATQEDKISILLVAAKKDAIFNYEDLFKKIGLRCECIEIGGVALSNCVQFLEDESDNVGVTLVVDIGKSGTEVSIINNGDLIFSRYLAVGGDFYNNALMQEMGITYKEAEKLKINSSLNEKLHPEVNHLVAANNEYFCDELLMRYEYFKKQFPNQKITNCYVTGGGSRMRSLVEAISKKINIPVQILDPFKKLKYSDSVKDSANSIRYLCPLTVGLCLRRGK